MNHTIRAPGAGIARTVRSLRTRAAFAGLLAVAAATAAPAAAHEGHDHAPAAAAATATPLAPQGPRFALATEAFELVGVVDGRRLTLWLDRFADGAPVADARIELEIGDRRLVARPLGDTYVAELAEPLPAGRLPVSATVVAGEQADLMAGELASDAPAAAPGAAAGAQAAVAHAAADWRVVAGALAAGALAVLAGRRLLRRRAPDGRVAS